MKKKEVQEKITGENTRKKVMEIRGYGWELEVVWRSRVKDCEKNLLRIFHLEIMLFISI